MKKLSEMGHEMWVSPTWGTATVPCPLHDESKLNGCGYFPARFYTAEERRELVRAVWDEALSAVVTIDDPIRQAADRYYADWIKDQGL